MRELIQRAVLATNPWWPFSSVNRVPYRLALGAVRRRLGRLRGVAGIYLRHGLTRGHWVPGISDIDLTVVVEDAQGLEADYALTCAIWAEYDALRRLFPMLGELDILPQRGLRVYGRLGVPGREVRTWVTLHGPDVSPLTYREDPERVCLDATCYALLYYTDFLMPLWFDSRPRTVVGVRRMVRVADKVARYAGRASGQPHEAPARHGMEPAAAIARSLVVLEAASLRGHDRVWAGDEAPAEQPEVSVAASRSDQAVAIEVSSAASAVSSVLQVAAKTIVLLRAGLSVSEIAVALQALGPVLAHRAEVIVVTPAVFSYLLRFQNPFLHAALRDSGTLQYGPAVVLPPAPHPQAFAHAVVAQAVNAIRTVRARGLVPPDDHALAASGALAVAVHRAIATAAWIRTGVVPTKSRAIKRLNAEVDPGSVAELARIVDEAGKRDAGVTGLHAFGLLRRLADDISDGFDRVDVERRLFRLGAG